MWVDYGVFGGSELWNNQRTYAYITNGVSDGNLQVKAPVCGRLPFFTDENDGVYQTPELDDAPWFDASRPESGDFGGIFVTAIEGFDTLGSRDVSTNPFGSVVSQRKLDEKILTVTAVIVGRTCSGTQYGYRWLLSRLLRRDCDGVEDSSLGLYDCCPTEDEVEGLSDEQIMDKFLRMMYRVRVGKDPEIIDRQGSCCGAGCQFTTLEVQWSFVLENQKLYRRPSLCLDEQSWGDDLKCLDWDCPDCDDTEYVEVEVVKDKVRFPVEVRADRSYCPVGGWSLSEYWSNTEAGYLDIVNVEQQPQPVNVWVTWDGRFQMFDYLRKSTLDLRDIDLCKVDFQVTHYVPGPFNNSQTEGAQDGGSELVAIGSDHAETEIKIKFIPSSKDGGTFEVLDGNTWPVQINQLTNMNIVVDQQCPCTDSDSTGELTLNPDGTWTPHFQQVGSFPPRGIKQLEARGQSAGNYIETVQVSVEDAFNGGTSNFLALKDSYEGVSVSYVQPFEWMQKCCKIEFNSGVERAEPYLEFFSGSATLYNFRADFFALNSADAYCICDELTEEQEAEWLCREPDFSVRAGRSIPAGSKLIYDPRLRQIKGINNSLSFDATPLVSGKKGSSPYFFDLPECYGVCVVLTAEVRKDESDEVVSPASDAYITAGYIPFTYVGV